MLSFKEFLLEYSLKKLPQHPLDVKDKVHAYEIHHDGENVGSLLGQVQDNQHFFVHGVTVKGGSNTIGTKDIRNFARQMKTEHGVKTIGGDRVSGARVFGPGKKISGSANVAIKEE